MENLRLSVKLNLAIAGLCIWLVLASVGLYLVEANAFILAVAILILTVTLTLLNIAPHIGWYATILGSLFFAFVQYNIQGLNTTTAIASGVFFIFLLLTTIQAYLVIRQILAANNQLERNFRIIEDLRLHDPQSGLLRWQYASQNLKIEVARSQRYNGSLSLLSIQVKEEVLNQKDEGGRRATLNQIANIINDSVRPTDIAFIKEEKFGIILTETDMDGAMVAGQRLIGRCANQARIPVYVGVAAFPIDGVSDEELIQASEAAMQFAATTGEPILPFSKIQKGLSKKTKKGDQAKVNVSDEKINSK